MWLPARTAGYQLAGHWLPLSGSLQHRAGRWAILYKLLALVVLNYSTIFLSHLGG